MTFEDLCQGLVEVCPELEAEQIREALRNIGVSVETGAFPNRLGENEMRVLTYLVGYAAGIAGVGNREARTRH